MINVRTGTRINPEFNIIEDVKPFAPTPDGGWTYEKGYVARSIYRYADDDEDRWTTVNVPDQVFEDQKSYHDKAFPTIEGEYVWLDGEAYGLFTSGTGDITVRDAVEPL